LREARRRLEQAGVPDASIAAEVLLAHALGTDRAFLRALDGAPPPDFDGLLQRACAREPVAYLTGRVSWWDTEIAVGPGVFVPSQETERVVEEFLRRLPPGARCVADLGTGSGAVAIALRRARPDLVVIGTERHLPALRWARRNDPRLALVRLDWCRGLCGLDGVIANPPYVAADEWPLVAPERRYQPREALDGGPDGLAAIRRIVRDAPGVLKPGGLLVLEIGFRQGDNVVALLESAGAYADVFRVRVGTNDRIVGATCIRPSSR
jgi:release factor glutamine methyltransferase